MARKKGRMHSESAVSEDGAPEPIDWSKVPETFEFKVHIGDKPTSATSISKKRKRGEPPKTDPLIQPNTLPGVDFEKTTYAISPPDWNNISHYRKFTIQNDTFEVNQCVLINLDPETRVGDVNNHAGHDVLQDHWVAQVLEVRAPDEQHVFLRVNWLYRPEDLPAPGRQPWHGAGELVPSNYMQVIDAMSVNGSVSVRRWDEEDEEEEPPEGLFYRQTYDVIKDQLSDVKTHCICQQPANPDLLLIRCSHCNEWLHAACIEREAVRRAYAAAGEAYPGPPSSKSGKKRGRPKGGRKSSTGAGDTSVNGHGPSAESSLFEATVVPRDEEAKDGAYVVHVSDQRHPTADIAEPAVREIKCLVCEKTID